MNINTAPNSPFKGYYPNVNPFGISPRYNGNTPLYNLYNKYKTNEINSTISKVDDIKEANAEIEKGEIVRQTLPNGGTLLHKALGKKHKDGGIPVNLPNNSFIFSNYKTTSLNKEELDTFKLGGFHKKVNNRTPSKILEKNVDIKHYNKMEKYLQESKNPVQLKTAQLMKEKYDKIVAKIAALQESKKPNTNMPNFAYLIQDTPELKEQNIQTEMYKGGGFHNSTYNDKQRFWAKQNQLHLYPEKTWKGTQHSRDGIYDQANLEEFKNRNQWFFDQNPNADMRNKEDVQKFQEAYNKMYADEFNGEQYFTGNDYNGVDGKFGNHTFNAPAFVRNSKQIYNNLNDYNNAINLPQNNNVQNIDGRPIVNRINNVGPALNYNRPQDNKFTNEQVFGLGIYPETNTNTDTETTNTPQQADFSKFDDLSWIKGYDWNPKMLSMLGNMAQYPRAYNPALSLEQPVRLREQQINAQPGINDILSNRYMSMKASNQYLPNSVANNQFIDSNVNKQIMDYRNQIDQSNQNISNDIHNKNAQIQNQIVNSNNDRRAQYLDKMNELYQNMANERNTINATNLNLLGQGLQEEKQTNLSNDILRRNYSWINNQNIQNKNTPELMQAEIDRINKLNMDETLKKTMLLQFFKKYYGTNPAVVNPYS